jgi:hypothetical protein
LAGIVGVVTVAQFDPGANFTLTVTDATGRSSTLDCTVKIVPLTILETSELPDAFVNAAYGYTLTPGNPSGSVHWSVPQGSDPLPAGLSLDAATGVISGTPSKAGSYDFHIMAADSNGATNWKHFKLNVSSVGFATSGALGNAKPGSFFSVNLAADGGDAPYRFSGSGLPAGLTLTADGFLSGTLSAGSNTVHRFDLTVSDSSGGSYTKQFALNVAGSSVAAPTLNYQDPTPDMAIGEPNSYRFSGDGGAQPYSWSINGALPPGLRLRRTPSRTGMGPLGAEIAGIPTEAGSYTFDVVLTDGNGSKVSQSVTLNVGAMTVDAPPSGFRGRPYNFYLRPVGGYPAYHWEPLGRLPLGLELDSTTGRITGTPLENGNFTVTVEIDATLAAGGKKTVRSVEIPVHSPTNPKISSKVPWRLADASVSIPVSYETGFCCGSASLTYSWSGTSPAGLSLNSVTGQISGTPTAPGSYRFTVTATDSADSANYGTREFFLMVSPRRSNPVVRPADHGNTASVAVAEPVGIRTSAPLASRATASAPAAGGVALNFVPITPCRVLDTRNQAGPFGGPAIAGGTSRDFNIPSSACGVPATAQAYSVNVAVVPTGPLGFITMWPTGQTQPLASTLNSLDGRIKSNAAIVLAGTGGSISIFASDTTHALLDINGYFVPATDPSALAFYPVTPCRIADTRTAPGALGGPSMTAAQSRTFPVLSACNIPATAQAYSLNFAVVPSGPLGFLAAWPTGQPQPLVSTLNALTGTVVANAAIVPAGTNGSINLFATDGTDVVIDVNGYFAPPGAGGVSMFPVAPCRVTDTRLPAGSAPITSLDVAVSSSGCGIPPEAQAHVFSATVVPPGGLGFLTLWPQGQTRPVVSTLNALDGAITSNMAIIPTTNGSISAFASSPTHLILDVSAYFAPSSSAGPIGLPSGVTVGIGGSAPFPISLPVPAPAGGVTVSLVSSDTSKVTVSPATVPIVAGQTTPASQPVVTGVAVGSASISASAPGYLSASQPVIVNGPPGTITVSSISVGQNLQALITVTLSTPVTGGPLNVSLASGDGNKLLIGSLLDQGVPMRTLQFPVGSTSGVAYAQALAGSGTVTVTASAANYSSGSGTVTLFPSAFLVTGPAGTVGVPSFPTNVGSATTLTVIAGRLNGALNYVETQGLRGGFSVTVPVSSGSAGQVNPPSLGFTPADTAYTTTFTALTQGAALVTVTEPTGFTAPAGGANTITANISPPGVSAPNAVVGQSLEVPAQITLAGAPGSPATITLVSSDPTKLRFGTSATDPGAGTIPIPACTPPVPDPTNVCKIIKIGAGQSHSPEFYIQALASSGSATYTATISGIGSSTGTVSFAPSGILIAGPNGLGNTIAVASGSGPSTLTVESARLDSSRNFVELQFVAPITGLPPVSVNISNSNAGVGTITASPVTIPAGQVSTTTSFQPGAAGVSGNTTISVDVPSGFTAPAAFGSIGASVGVPGIGILSSGPISLGKFLQVQDVFTLGAPAPAGTVVTLTSNNPSQLLLSTSPTAAGSTFITVPVATGGFGGTYYIQAFGSSGVATFTASANGFASHTGTVTLTPSGVIVWDGFTPGATIVGHTATVSLAQLNPVDNTLAQVQQLAGGVAPVSVAMSTDIVGATISSPITINPGSDHANATLTGAGTGHVTATTPPGFTNSNILTTQIFLF